MQAERKRVMQYSVLLHIQNRLQDLEDLLVHIKSSNHKQQTMEANFSEIFPRNIATRKFITMLDWIWRLISTASLLHCKKHHFLVNAAGENNEN